MSTVDERLIGGHSGRILATLSVSLALVRIGRRALPPLLPTIITDLTLTPFQAGFALSTGAIGFALLQFPSGRLSDQLTRKTVLLSSFFIVALGALLFALTNSFLLLLVSVSLLGIGEGLFGAADRGYLSDLFVERRGVAFGVHTMFSDIGGILAAGLATAAITIGAWQTAFLPPVIGLIVMGGLVHQWGREPVVFDLVSLDTRGTVRRLLDNSDFRWILFVYSLFAAVTQGVVGFLPALLQTDFGYSPAFASILFAAMFGTGVVVRPLAGRLSDGRSRLVIAGIGLGIAGLGLIILLTSVSPFVSTMGVLVFAIGQKTFPPTMQAHLMDTFPDSSMAGDLGAMRTVYIGAGSIGPVYVGYVATQASYTIAFSGFITTLIIGGIIVLSVFRFNHR